MDLFVTNKNAFHHTDRYAGIDYGFPPNEPVCISHEAATHMFGFNLVDKTPVLARLGWANAKYDRTKPDGTPDLEWGAKQLAKFVFQKATVVMEEVKAAPAVAVAAVESEIEGA